MNIQNRPRSINQICEDCRDSAYLATMKTPCMYLSLAGIWVPHFCARNVFKPKDSLHALVQYNNKNMHVADFPSIAASIPYEKSRGMTEVNILHYGTNGKRINETKIGRSIIHKKSRKIKPEEKKNFNSKINNKCVVERPSTCCKRSYTTYLKIACCCFYIAVAIFDIARQLYMLPGTLPDDNRFAYSLGNVTFRLFLLFINVTNNYANFKHFRQVCCAWLEYERRYGMKLGIQRYRKRVRNLIALGIFVNMTVFLTVCAGIMTSFEGFNFLLWPFDVTSMLGRCLAGILFGFVSFVGSCNVMSVHAFRSTIVYLLISEFKYLHDRMTEILSETATQSRAEEEFDKLIEQLRALIDLSQKSFQVVKHSIAAAYMFTPVLLCLVVYDIAGGTMMWNQNLLTIYTVVIVLVMILSTTKACAELRSKARSVWSAVYKVTWCNHSPALLHKLSIFMNQLSVDDVSYSVYGMFTVDYSSLMMVGGTILTYGIFVLELRLQDKK